MTQFVLNTIYIAFQLAGGEIVGQTVRVVLVDGHGNFVELGDEGVFGPVHDNLRDNDEKRVRKTGNKIICKNKNMPT